MRPSQALVALWGLAPVSMGLPSVDETEEPQAFTLHKEYAGTYLKHGTLEMFETYKKYNATMHKDLVNAAEAVRRGSVKNFPGAEDSYYLVPTKIGTPGQTLMLDLDTGSSDLWCYSSETPAGTRAGHSYYKPASSKTSKKIKGATWGVKYGDGSTARGNVFKDIVHLGPIAAKNQGVESAQRVTGNFAKTKAIDGLIGSGFGDINTVRPTPQKPWYQNANLQNKLFCADLKDKGAGSYDIGYINAQHHKGPIHYTKLSTTKNGYWEFTTGGYSVGGGKHYPTSFNAIADTGTSVAYVPFSAIKKFYKSIPSAAYNNQVGGIIYKCSDKLPAFHITIGGSKRTIPSADLNGGFVGTSGGSRFCFGGLQANTGMHGLSILGDTFLKSQYVVFDFGAKRIGFANK